MGLTSRSQPTTTMAPFVPWPTPRQWLRGTTLPSHGVARRLLAVHIGMSLRVSWLRR